MAKQVYVYFQPVLIDIPDVTHDKLSSESSAEVEEAKMVCAMTAAQKMSEVKAWNVPMLACVMLDQVVKA